MNAAEPAREAGSRILVVVAEMGHVTQREIRGVRDYARRAGWSVDIVEGRHFGNRPDFARWIDFWRPDGLIVDPEYARRALADKAAKRLPMVIWDASMASGLPKRCARVASDPEDIAGVVARELLRTGHPHIAFVPALRDPPWSRDRAAAFGAAIEGFGRAVVEFRPPPEDAGDAHRFREGLARFLKALPKPCGVFAANDATAALVVSACAECGLAIPDDIALVGVDDSEEYCECGQPTITSVRHDVEGGGAAAAELLASMMRPGSPARPVVRYGVERLVRRASTSVLRVRDGRVSRAMEWIRLHAARPIDVADVVAEMGCSRALAFLRFRQATGHTILDEVHARRIDLAKALLKEGVPIDALPERCGYVRGPHLGILFKRATGLTMRQWRASQGREN